MTTTALAPARFRRTRPVRPAPVDPLAPADTLQLLGALAWLLCATPGGLTVASEGVEGAGRQPAVLALGCQPFGVPAVAKRAAGPRRAIPPRWGRLRAGEHLLPIIT